MENRDLRFLEDEYRGYCIECRTALSIVMANITSVKEALARTTQRSPFNSITERIKSFDSIVEKCERRDYEATIESIKHNVLDVAGVRIITPFLDDIFTVVEMLHHIPGLNIDEEKDYVTEPKPNGYKSYHLHTRVEIFSPVTGGSKLIPVEIQVRDKAMDLWATIEHILKYKKDNPSPEVESQFERIAEVLSEFDNIAIELRDFNSESDKIRQGVQIQKELAKWGNDDPIALG